MLSNDFEILGTTIERGSSHVLNLEVAKLHTRTPIKVPVLVERAKKDGPVVLLMSGVHGDEVNGVAILRDIIRKKYHKPTSGIIICIPVFNIFGYLIQTREFPDGRDLNRMFPGSKNGSLASQFANQFTMEIAPLVDYVIDFHTGGAERDNVPQIRCDFSDKTATDLAHVFRPPYIVHSESISKSIRDTLIKLGKTILLFEGGKSKSIDPKIVDVGVAGARNVLCHLGMLRGEITQEYESKVIHKSKWIRSTNSGMFRPLVENGATVKKRDIIGLIQDPFGDFERKVRAPFDCHIFCTNTSPIINKGNALFHVSAEEDPQ
jgi:hypothetical protein